MMKNRLIHITLMFSIFILGCFVATQLTAVQFRFDEMLEQPVIHFLHLYSPFNFWKWFFRYGNTQGSSYYFRAGWICILITVFIILCYCIWLNVIEWLKRQEVNTHGSAHFATRKEINSSGLLINLNEPSVYIGAYEDPLTGKTHYLKDSSATHVFVFAPSRSGKGVGLIIPTLLSYTSSVIISDFKLENWYLTAGFRKSLGHLVLKFDPTCTDESTIRFNPLFEIRKSEHEVRDAQLIADMLVDPDGKNLHDHWSNAANSLLVSTILHVLYTQENKSLAGVRNFLSDPNNTENETLQLMLTSGHPIVASGAREMLNKSEAERSSIISSALTFLKLYRDPIISKNTSSHDFKIIDLVNHAKPISLYLGIPPSDIGRTMPLMRLMLQMILSRLTESLELKSQHRQLLLMLDEFPQFGKLPFFEKALSYSAGYNIRAYLISQDIQQIYKEYGREQSIVSNCGIRIAYAPNTLETAKYLSESLGSMTLRQKQINYSGKRFEWLLHQISISEHDIKRSLLTPDELMRLSQDAVLIFKNSIAPIKGKKIYYYLDPNLNEKTLIPAPKISDKTNTESSCWTQEVSDAGLTMPFGWLHQSSSLKEDEGIED